jgi:hypothetical protein
VTADHRIPGFSAADMAAIKVIAEGQIATNQALAELAHTIAARWRSAG